MISLRTAKLIVAIAAVAVVYFLTGYFLSIASGVHSAFASCVLLFIGPAQFIGSIRGDGNARAIKLCAMMTMAFVGLTAAYSLHFAHTAGYLTEDSTKTWLKLIHSACVLYFLPFFFGCIRKRTAQGRQRAASEPFIVTLPGGIVVGFTFLPGSLMDTVVRSNECRAAAYYYCSYVIHCVCTLAPAAAAAWFGLIKAETSLVYVTVCSAVSTALYLPIFFNETLNTPKYSKRASWALVPTLAATFLLQAYGGVELKEIGSHAEFIRNIVWIPMCPLTTLANAN